MTRLPNFFIAGVSKAGTTSLHSYLDQHPQVFMSRLKEPSYFAATDLLSGTHRVRVLNDRARNRAELQAYLDGPQAPLGWRLVLEWNDYLRVFRDARDETVVGESSTCYFWLPGAARAIRERLPHARVAIVLRDPAERLFTLYGVALSRYPRVSFPAWFRAMQDQPLRRPSIIGAAEYATHLQRFFDVFPREQLRVLLYQDYQTDAQAVVRDLFAFLGVDPDHPVDVSRRHNVTVVPRFPRLHALRRRLFGRAHLTRWLPQRARAAIRRVSHRAERGTMDPADRRLVIDFYRDEILRTSDLIRRDLSAWLH